MLHFDSSDDSPRNCAEEGGNPAKDEVHAVVGGGVVEEHIYNQDIVEMKTLGKISLWCILIKLLIYLQKHPMEHCCP